MTAPPIAALMLAVAALISPVPARHRLPVGRGPSRHTAPPWVGRACAAIGTVTAVAVLPTSLVAVTAMVVGGLIVLRRRRDTARFRRTEGTMVAAALEILIGELRVGAHPVRAFTIAAAESGGTVGASLRAVAARARLGADVVAGLRAVASDSAVPAYWLRLAVFWELATRHGLPMSVLMGAAHRDVVERHRFAAQTQAALAGARATAVILALLPLLGVLLGQLIGAHPLRFLLGGGAGDAVLVVGVGLIGAGLAWADHIIGRLAP